MCRTTVDVAGAAVGGAARFAGELYRYLEGAGRQDVRVLGTGRRLTPRWLARREFCTARGSRKVALNNVGFLSPGGERWTLLRNALHFLTDTEYRALDGALAGSLALEAKFIQLAARRSDVLVVPCAAMAERVAKALPAVRDRIVIRHHPVSADSIPAAAVREPAILCPVLFAPYKQMDRRLSELLHAMDACCDSSARLRVTADEGDLPSLVASHPRTVAVGRLNRAALGGIWARSTAIYFPTGIESFGYPLAEARVSGHPVLAQDTGQNREIAGPALCGFAAGDHDSLCQAVKMAFSVRVEADPQPFDPVSYFSWLLAGEVSR